MWTDSTRLSEKRPWPPRYIVAKLSKIKDKERFLKLVNENVQLHVKENPLG